MRSKLIAAIVVVLSGTTAVLAQTNFSGTLQCSKAGTIQELVIQVEDHPDHSLMISKRKCTFAKPIEIAGTQMKEVILDGLADVTATEALAHTYATMNCANGDKSYGYQQFSGLLKGGPEEPDIWNFTGGTGKLKGIRGKGTWKYKAAADGSEIYEIKGEYELPK